MATSESLDAIVLDRNLPEIDGLSILKVLRAANNATPILILSALAHADERIKGLRAGADEYLAEPFSFSELQLRLENLLKRRGSPAEMKLTCGDLEMDLFSRTVSRAGKPIDLLQREFLILEQLMRHKDKVVTRTMLLEQVWDYHFNPHTNLIDAHVRRMRKKIDEGFDRPLLHSVRSVGYRLSETA